MTDNSIHVDRPGLKSLFAEQPDVVVAYLFGSAARGQVHAGSDIDVAVLFAPEVEAKTCTERQLQLMGELERFSDREVQVTVLNRATPLLAYEVIRHSEILFERNPEERVEFEVRAMKIYFDLQRMYHDQDRSLSKQIKEEGIGKRKRRTESFTDARRVYERPSPVPRN